jgi:nicotinate-nucleotide pyrophosphorylase (carboxylating)
MIKSGLKLVKKLSKITKKRPKIEISGGISLKTIKKYAKLGVDYISIGALTHSARAADINLTIKPF